MTGSALRNENGRAGSGGSVVYACTTDDCSERFRGFTDEPTFCSICMADLTEVANPDGLTVDQLNDFAASAPRPMPEGDLA